MTPRRSTTPPENSAPAQKPIRVLIVEDDAEFRRVLFRFLQAHAGFDCVAVSCGAEVSRACAHRSPDVILLDLRLRDMNGFDVLRLLHADARTAAIPVILYTGESRALDLLSAASRSSNAFAFLHKPFDFNDAAELVRRAAASREHLDPRDPWTIVRAPVRIDLRLRLVRINEVELELGPKRFESLCALARSKDGLTVPLLRVMVWGSDREPENTVVKTVNRLRQDLRAASGLDVIVPIPGGYKLQ